MSTIESQNSRPSALDKISRGAGFLSGLAVLAVTLMITFDVLMRYFLNQPQLFVDELASFLLVVIIFGGLAFTFQRGGHIQVDLLTNRLAPRRRRALRIFTLFLGAAFLGIVSWNTLVSSVVAYRLDRLSMVLFYPLWIPMLIIPVGLGLMAITMGVKVARELAVGGKTVPEGTKGDSKESAN